MLILVILSLVIAVLLPMTAATVYISETNLVGAVVTDNIANLNFGSIDSPNLVAADHPIIQGERAFWKLIRFKVHSLGTSTTIKDLRWWKSGGTYVTGEAIDHSDRSIIGSSVTYTTPSDGSFPQSNTALLIADPGSATVGIAGSTAGTITAAPTYSEYMFAQLKTTASTPVGAVNTKTIIFQYDES